MNCKLKQTLIQDFINDDGTAKIIPKWDEEAVRACPICGGFKFLEKTDERGYRTISPCPGTYALQRIDTYNQADVPSRFMNATLENFQIERLRETANVKSFIRNIKSFKKGNSGYLLEGGPGTGKTHLLCAAIRYLTLEIGIPCRYVDYSNLLSDIRAAYSQNVPEASFIEPIARIPVLFMDELGKGRDKKNDFELRIIDEIINRRYSNPDLTTFFASNYLDRDSSGYNKFMNGGEEIIQGKKITLRGYGSSDWDMYVQKRYKKEGFDHPESFKVHADQIMRREHIEDRVSERTFSRIRAMADPIVVNAPDFRRIAGR